MWILVLLIVIVVSIYIPFVQDALVPIVLEKVSESTGMDITVEKFRLRFPIDVEVTGAKVIEASGDTMLLASHARLNVSVLPLLEKTIEADDITARGAYYRLGQPDSSLFLKANVESFDLDHALLALSDDKIDVNVARIKGGRVDMIINPDTIVEPEDTTDATPWLIRAGLLHAKDIDFRMKMMPTIDSLHTALPIAVISNAIVDLGKNSVNVSAVKIDSLSATYLTPSYAYLKSHPQKPSAKEEADDNDSEPWTIRVDTVRVDNADALYAVRDSRPVPGFDPDHIRANDISIAINNFYNRSTDVIVPIESIRAKERCGLQLSVAGRFAMNSDGIAFENGDITTLHSSIKVDATLGLNEDKLERMPFNLAGDARIGMADVMMFMPSLTPTVKNLPKHTDLNLTADVDGTLADVNIKRLNIALPNHAQITAKGRLANITNMDKITGKLSLDGDIKNINFLKPTILEAKLAKQVNLPPTKLKGDVNFAKGDIKGNLKAVTSGGALAMDAFYSGRREDYDIDMSLNRFPIRSFMPELPINNITADIKAKGHGFNPLSQASNIDATISVTSADYYDSKLANIDMWANLEGGDFEAGIVSVNQDIDIDMTAKGHISDNDVFDIDLNGDIRNLDLKALRLSDTPMHGSLSVSGNAHIALRDNVYNADLKVGSIDWTYDDMILESTNLTANISTNDTLVSAYLKDDGIDFNFVSHCRLDEFTNRISKAADIAMKQVNTRQINVDAIQKELPRFNLTAHASTGKNILSGPLSLYEISFSKIDAEISNTDRIDISADIEKLHFGETQFDAISVNAHQHSKYLIYNVSIDNVPGNLDEFAHIDANGYLADDVLQTFIKQQNRKGETGYNLGFTAELADSVVTLNFAPLTPTIAYKQWSLNEDNFIKYNLYTSHFDANFDMRNDDSFIKIFTEHDAEHAHDHENGGDDADRHSHEEASYQEDVILKAGGIKIEEWLAFMPGLPPFSGVVDADLRFRWDKKSISGDGNLKINDLCYDKQRLGSFDNDVSLSTDDSGIIRANAAIKVDGHKAVNLTGVINNPLSDKPFDLDLSMIRFPLSTINPFLPKTTMQLSGAINGDLCIAGSAKQPILNGKLAFDSASVDLPSFGSKLRMTPDEVPIVNSVITFNKYHINSLNENPLEVNGTVDLRKLSNPKIDLVMAGREMLIIDSEASKKVTMYGKGFVTANATVKGDFKLLDIYAQVNVVDKSDITYVLGDFDASKPTQSSDIVHFVSFENPDTTIVDVDDEYDLPLAMNLVVNINVATNTNLTIDLLSDNKLTAQGGGNLTFKIDPSDAMSMVGKYTIDKGRVKYKPPLIPEVNFEIERGSFISFNGDVLNPILSLHGDQKKTATVESEYSYSRRADFTISVDISNTLSNMNIVFDMSSTDLAAQNELQSMSADQRSNQAMNMLLYGSYTGLGKGANIFGSSNGGAMENALYSFLAGQLNSWAKNVKFVDLSFGVDQYSTTSIAGETQKVTNYSYKVSKSFLDDRAKIMVGGNYSTDAKFDENFSQNIISDISIEYLLNKRGTMYVRIFRHTGHESILEGEIVQTGAGFIYRRPMRRLSDLFRFIPRRRPAPKTTTPNDSVATDKK